MAEIRALMFEGKHISHLFAQGFCKDKGKFLLANFLLLAQDHPVALLQFMILQKSKTNKQKKKLQKKDNSRNFRNFSQVVGTQLKDCPTIPEVS